MLAPGRGATAKPAQYLFDQTGGVKLNNVAADPMKPIAEEP